MSVFFYRRPNYITKQEGPLNLSSCQKYSTCDRTAIPPNLSFDNVIGGKTLPPCSLQDFMDYLVYVAHDAENLQFYLWLMDYNKRFDALAESEKSLSPEWAINEQAPRQLNHSITPKASDKTLSSLGIIKETSLFIDQEDVSRTTTRVSSDAAPLSPSRIIIKSPTTEFSPQNGLVDWRTHNMQPFRSEIQQITNHYIQAASPRELNISHRTRATLLTALQTTTHPSAFTPVLDPLILSLRHQSHPNFIRWSICNGNKPRVFFLRSVSIVSLIVGVIFAVLLSLSKCSRWWRMFVLPLAFIATTMFVASIKGLCVILHGSGTREVRPWELDSPYLPLKSTLSRNNINENNPSRTSNISKSPLSPTDLESHLASYSGEKLTPLGSTNIYIHEPWVRKWKAQAWWQKLRLKKVWVQEEGLRLMQNKIIRQSQAWGLVISIGLTALAVGLPVVGLI